MKKDTVKITKKQTLNNVYNPFAPVPVGFKFKANRLAFNSFNCLEASGKEGHGLTTSIVQDIKVNKEKFKAKIYTMNSIYVLKFKAKEESELYKQINVLAESLYV